MLKGEEVMVFESWNVRWSRGGDGEVVERGGSWFWGLSARETNKGFEAGSLCLLLEGDLREKGFSFLLMSLVELT